MWPSGFPYLLFFFTVGRAQGNSGGPPTPPFGIPQCCPFWTKSGITFLIYALKWFFALNLFIIKLRSVFIREVLFSIYSRALPFYALAIWRNLGQILTKWPKTGKFRNFWNFFLTKLFIFMLRIVCTNQNWNPPKESWTLARVRIAPS